jgi:hypothetical protein
LSLQTHERGGTNSTSGEGNPAFLSCDAKRAAPAGEEGGFGEPTLLGSRGQMIIAGLIGIRQLPAERMHLYEKERIAQEEYRLQQDIIRCQGDTAGLYTQIEVIDFEFSLL